VVREWIERNLGPIGQFAEGGKGLRAIGRAALDLPDMLGRIERITAQAEQAAAQGVQLSPASVEAIGRAEARRNRWNAAALWIIAALLALAILR
jgi:ubiquinone biosynthesis protein